MTKEEYTELKKMADEVKAGDVHLGRMLHTMVDHLGHLGGVHTPVSEAAAAAEEEEAPAPSRRSKA